MCPAAMRSPPRVGRGHGSGLVRDCVPFGSPGRRRERRSLRERPVVGDSWPSEPNHKEIGASDVDEQYQRCRPHRAAHERPRPVDGRLDWREWETKDGRHAQAVRIIAQNVQFLSGAPAATATTVMSMTAPERCTALSPRMTSSWTSRTRRRSPSRRPKGSGRTPPLRPPASSR